MPSTPSSSSTRASSSATPSTQSSVMECCLENFDEEVLLEALLSPGKEILEASIAPTQLSPARQRQRLDHAGAGRPAPRSLQAELVDAEEAEPDARPDDMEPVLPSTQDGQDAALHDDEVIVEVVLVDVEVDLASMSPE